MRRLASLFVLAFAMVALVGLPTAAHDREHDRVRHKRAPSFAVLVGSARQGGTMLIAVRVGPPRWHHRRSRAKTKELTATAVVHFASGDVQVTLTPRMSKARFLAWSKGRGYPGAHLGQAVLGSPDVAQPVDTVRQGARGGRGDGGSSGRGRDHHVWRHDRGHHDLRQGQGRQGRTRAPDGDQPPSLTDPRPPNDAGAGSPDPALVFIEAAIP